MVMRGSMLDTTKFHDHISMAIIILQSVPARSFGVSVAYRMTLAEKTSWQVTGGVSLNGHMRALTL